MGGGVRTGGSIEVESCASRHRAIVREAPPDIPCSSPPDGRSAAAVARTFPRRSVRWNRGGSGDFSLPPDVVQIEVARKCRAPAIPCGSAFSPGGFNGSGSPIRGGAPSHRAAGQQGTHTGVGGSAMRRAPDPSTRTGPVQVSPTAELPYAVGAEHRPLFPDRSRSDANDVPSTNASSQPRRSISRRTDCDHSADPQPRAPPLQKNSIALRRRRRGPASITCAVPLPPHESRKKEVV